MKKNLISAILYTVVTTVLLGICYPLIVTGLAQLLFRDKANGQLIPKGSAIIGSRIIAQPFTGPQYFHPRPSAAGRNGYAGDNSSGSNLGPTNQKLVDRIKADVSVLQTENPDRTVPTDMVTTSGSGLDPHVTPAAAMFQIGRVARARGIDEKSVTALVAENTQLRQFGVLGEPGVNVLELNLALDEKYPLKK